MNDLQDVSAISNPAPVRRPLLRRLLQQLWQSFERARTRRLLAQLDGRELADLGLSNTDRLNEMEKPFWR